MANETRPKAPVQTRFTHMVINPAPRQQALLRPVPTSYSGQKQEADAFSVSNAESVVELAPWRESLRRGLVASKPFGWTLESTGSKVVSTSCRADLPGPMIEHVTRGVQ